MDCYPLWVADLQNTESKTIIMVEQNDKKGLEFADIGYVLVSVSYTHLTLQTILLE